MLFTYIKVNNAEKIITCQINHDAPFASFEKLFDNYCTDKRKRTRSFSDLSSIELNECRFEIIDRDRTGKFSNADDFMKVLKENNLL